MKLKSFLAVCMILIAPAAFAKSVIFEAKISNITGGAALLDYIGIQSGGMMTARVTYDTDTEAAGYRSCGYPCQSHYLKTTPITGFTLSSSTKSFDLLQATGVTPSVAMRDYYSYDRIAVSYYNHYSIGLENANLTSILRDGNSLGNLLGRRGVPVTAELLNTFETTFSLGLYFVDPTTNRTMRESAISTEVVWSEVSAVPLPAGMVLMLSAIGGLTVLRRVKS